MSVADLPLVSPAARWQRAARAGWDTLDERTRTTCKVVVLGAVTVLGYHYSLETLLQTIGLDTPLAYVSLVPLLACGLAWVNRHPRAAEPAVHDRELDYIVGLPLVGAAVVAQVVLPGRVGTMFWVDRLDLFFLPLFVTGATILLFGLRVAWRQKVALAYLFLAWPWLYTSVLLGSLGGLTSLTVRGLDGALDLFHVATPVAGNPGLFSVMHGGQRILISVVTACSGVDGMVGFLLIGVALASVVNGSILRKAMWLATGLVLFWVLNLSRLVLICWAAAATGQHFALDVLHPVAGLVMFCVGAAAMSALLVPFGLMWTSRPAPTAAALPSSAAPRAFAVGVILLVAGLALSVSDARLSVFNPLAGAAGDPRLGSFLADPAVPAGWNVNFETEYLMSKPLFGQDSRWFRYVYSTSSPTVTSMHSTLPVTADVVDAGSVDGFTAYGVTACYSFHGYALRDVATVGLGDGIVGQALSYSGGTAVRGEDWSIVYWIWPVKTGGGTRYERVILYIQNTASDHVALAPGSEGAAQLDAATHDPDPAERRLLVNRAFLVAFARQVVADQSHQHDTGVLIDAVRPADRLAGLPSDGAGPSVAVGTGQTLFWLKYFTRVASPALASGSR